MKLFLNLIQKDFKKNKVITIALTVFKIISSLFIAGGLRIVGTMISSMNGLNEIAVMPDYLQMHKGAYEEDEFKNFVKNHEYIKSSLVVDMLNIRNANISYKGETFEKYLMDNGFVVQNEEFDFLLNMDNEIAEVTNGYIGIPVYYAQALDIQVGDVIELNDGNYSKKLTVATVIRDSSMNPALTSSKRFLVSQADLDEIRLHTGESEYLFEFLLEDGTSTSVLEKDYMDAKMPSNGVALAASALMMMNTISYGVVAFIIMAISFILIIIALLCLSYIIRATMAEENSVIGEMKAIGFPEKSIRKLYQVKYLMLILIAGIVGYILSIPFGNFFSTSIIMYCGYGNSEWMKWVFPFIGVILLILIVIRRCSKIIRKNLKSTVVELLRGEEKIKKQGHYSLPSAGLKRKNLAIALGELRCSWKEYIVLFFIFAISSFLILLPLNMRNTVENPSFMTYMGVGESDIRIDIQYSDNLGDQKAIAITYLENDPDITKYVIFQNSYVQFQNSNGDWEYLRVENGDESVFPLEYLEGNSPRSKSEISLSYLIASESGKKVGDSLTVTYLEEELTFSVSGIYQDITYGGKTAKAAIEFAENDVEVYIIYLNVSKNVTVLTKTEELRSVLSDSKITPINEFVSQTLGSIMDDLVLVERAAIIISILLITLITVMFLELVTAREHSEIAIKKAIGFTNKDIRIQFGIRILIIQIIAILIGTVLSNILGEMIFGLMLSSMGASKITIIVDPILSYFLYPFVQLIIVFITVIIATGVIKKFHIRNQINE